MGINRAAVEKLRLLLGDADAKEIVNNATIAERIERTWIKKLDELIAGVTAGVVARARDTGEAEAPATLEDMIAEFFLRHELATKVAASTTLHPPEHHEPTTPKLAKKPPPSVTVGSIYPPGAKGKRIVWNTTGTNSHGQTVYDWGKAIYDAGVKENAERAARTYNRAGGGIFIEFINKKTGERVWYHRAGYDEVKRLPGKPPDESPRTVKAKPMPRTAKQAKEALDEFKKTGKLPPEVASRARKVASIYIQKLQELWRKSSDDFVEGKAKKNGEWNPDAFDQEAARRAIQKAVGVSRARARTIVETETTRYYNDARREFYDEIETVEGYLFAIVRDSATTKWCLSRGTKGGLVFFKGTALLEKNTPPCHWNCRSELLPLSRLNPTHKRLLNDEDRWAKNNKLVPLPPGWNA